MTLEGKKEGEGKGQGQGQGGGKEGEELEMLERDGKWVAVKVSGLGFDLEGWVVAMNG